MYLEQQLERQRHSNGTASASARQANELPRTGAGNFGDNPFFIQRMHDWFMKNEGSIACAACFDVDGAPGPPRSTTAGFRIRSVCSESCSAADLRRAFVQRGLTPSINRRRSSVLHASSWDRILHDFARYVRTGQINPE